MNAVKLLLVITGLALLLGACVVNRTTNRGEMYPWHEARSGVLHLRTTHTAPYCGGADPGPDGMPKPGPWQGMMFLRPATPDSTGRMALNDLTLPVTDTIRTDRTGNGYRTLKAGTYVLLDQDRVDDRRYRQLLKDHAEARMYTEAIDKACLEHWLRGPFGAVAIVAGDTTRIDLNLFDQCPWYNTPCVGYLGPLPP